MGSMASAAAPLRCGCVRSLRTGRTAASGRRHGRRNATRASRWPLPFPSAFGFDALPPDVAASSASAALCARSSMPFATSASASARARCAASASAASAAAAAASSIWIARSDLGAAFGSLSFPGLVCAGAAHALAAAAEDPAASWLSNAACRSVSNALASAACVAQTNKQTNPLLRAEAALPRGEAGGASRLLRAAQRTAVQT